MSTINDHQFGAIVYDVIVVGAGPGGSAIAALLAQAGLRVLLADKNAAAGGKMLAVHRDGFDYELFPINAVPARNSLFEKLVRDLELGDAVEVIYPNPVGRFYCELPGGEIRTLEMPGGQQPSPFGFKRLLGLSWIGFVKFLRIMAEMVAMPPERTEALAGTSALDYVEAHRLPQSLKSYRLSVYTEGYFEAPPDRVSAAAMIRAVQ